MKESRFKRGIMNRTLRIVFVLMLMAGAAAPMALADADVFSSGAGTLGGVNFSGGARPADGSPQPERPAHAPGGGSSTESSERASGSIEEPGPLSRPTA
jgi:hypothetical protein